MDIYREHVKYTESILNFFLKLPQQKDIIVFNNHLESDKFHQLFENHTVKLIPANQYQRDDQLIKERSKNLLQVINNLSAYIKTLKNLLRILILPIDKTSVVANFKAILESTKSIIILSETFQATLEMRETRTITRQIKLFNKNNLITGVTQIREMVISNTIAYINTLKNMLSEIDQTPLDVEFLVCIIDENISAETNERDLLEFSNILNELKQFFNKSHENPSYLQKTLIRYHEDVNIKIKKLINDIPPSLDLTSIKQQKTAFKTAHQKSFTFCCNIKKFTKNQSLLNQANQIIRHEKIYSNTVILIERLFKSIKDLEIDPNQSAKKTKYFQQRDKFMNLSFLAKTYKSSVIEKLKPLESVIFTKTEMISAADKNSVGKIEKKITICHHLIETILALKPDDEDLLTITERFSALSTFEWRFSALYNIYTLWQKNKQKQAEYRDYKLHGEILCEELYNIQISLNEQLNSKQSTGSLIKSYQEYFLEYTLQQIFKILTANNPTFRRIDQTLWLGGCKSKLIKLLIDFRQHYPIANDRVIDIGQTILSATDFLDYKKINNEFIPEFLFFSKELLDYNPVALNTIQTKSMIDSQL